MKDSFWGICTARRDRHGRVFRTGIGAAGRPFLGWAPYERRRGKRRDYRNGYYERDFVIRFGTIRLRVPAPGAGVFCRWGCSAFGRVPKRFRC
jgi:hypothetical protein